MKKTLAFALAALALSAPAGAKDLSGRWGVGFTKALSPESTFGEGLTSLSVRYWLDKQLGLEGVLGYKLVNRDDGPDERYSSLGGRFLIKMVEEENLQAYGGAGLAFLYAKEGEDSGSGVGVEAFVGAEYFFQGLPNLGFSSELGLQLSDTGDTTVFGTGGGSFIDFGIRYYF